MKLFGTMLITGCGGDIPIALARIARKEALCDRLIGTDIHSDHPGPAFFDSCHEISRATEECYFEKLAELMNNGAISQIYAHLMSLAGWDRLIALTLARQMPITVANVN